LCIVIWEDKQKPLILVQLKKIKMRESEEKLDIRRKQSKSSFRNSNSKTRTINLIKNSIITRLHFVLLIMSKYFSLHLPTPYSTLSCIDRTGEELKDNNTRTSNMICLFLSLPLFPFPSRNTTHCILYLLSQCHYTSLLINWQLCNLSRC